MGNCLSKFNDDKSFTLLQDRPLASGHLKNLLSGVQKNRVKYFASGVHREYGHQRITQCIKSSLMDVYDRFPLQYFELLDRAPQSLRPHSLLGCQMGVLNSLSPQSLKSKNRARCIINNLRCTMIKGTPQVYADRLLSRNIFSLLEKNKK